MEEVIFKVGDRVVGEDVHYKRIGIIVAINFPGNTNGLYPGYYIDKQDTHGYFFYLDEVRKPTPLEELL